MPGVQEMAIISTDTPGPGFRKQGSSNILLDDWVKDIDSWDVCDQVCMNLFEKTPLARKKILDWSEREEEFVKRAAFALIAGLAWHDKEADDEEFLELFPVIMHGATDERNFVKKAVNWVASNAIREPESKFV